jgi:NADPH-dependent ferric siderophore reductase
VHRLGAEPGSTTLLVDALATLPLPRGGFHAWIACESATAKRLRTNLLTNHGAHPAWTKAAGYWRRGSAATHDTHED